MSLGAAASGFGAESEPPHLWEHRWGGFQRRLVTGSTDVRRWSPSGPVLSAFDRDITAVPADGGEMRGHGLGGQARHRLTLPVRL